MTLAAASGADTTVVAAFAVGLVSFVSPCVLPLVPGYLSAVSGVGIAEMQAGEHRRTSILWPAAIFCLSFSIMFVALGMTATGIGSTLRDEKETLDKAAGILIVAMGVFFLLTPFVPRLNREWRPEALMSRAGSGGPIIAGLAFAVAWTPCVGPTLASILAAASTADSVGHGGVLLAFYSLGLAVPFLLTPFVPKLNREWRPEALISRAGSGGPIIAGLAFAVAWTPCVGPTLASILAAASTADSVGHGGVLLAFYSLGLAVPFLLTAVLFGKATATFRWIREHYVVVTAVSGLILIGMGLLMLTGELTRLNVEAQRFLDDVGLDVLYRI